MAKDVPIHRSFHDSIVRRAVLTGSVALPDMGLVIPNFIMKCMIDCDSRPRNLIDPVHVTLKLRDMRTIQNQKHAMVACCVNTTV